MSNKTKALLVESAKQSLNKILEKSNISEWIKINQTPRVVGKSKNNPSYIDAYGSEKFELSGNVLNLLCISIHVEKGNSGKTDRSNPREIQFRLISGGVGCVNGTDGSREKATLHQRCKKRSWMKFVIVLVARQPLLKVIKMAFTVLKTILSQLLIVLRILCLR
ncbi:hypothetical protein [Parasalinivibrio latis]|uniref:hypothetical protein n=1 Tax=Parasalinivibrio latis TaxID=2952610 RepID=UPI003DA254C5